MYGIAVSMSNREVIDPGLIPGQSSLSKGTWLTNSLVSHVPLDKELYRSLYIVSVLSKSHLFKKNLFSLKHAIYY